MEKITEIVINYRNNPITNYAILIDGAWGFGKTYFFKNEVKEGIDKIIFKAKSEIRKAKEYQESLITQVVTGQLKVPDNAKFNLGHDIDLGMVAEPNSESGLNRM